MADQTTGQTDIQAGADEVMAVIADLPAYPEWVDSVTAADVVERDADGRPRRVRMRLQHPLISDRYVLAYDWGDAAVSWRLVEGEKLTAMDGSYTLAPGAGPGVTRVHYALAVDVAFPLPGMLRRKAERTIIAGALAGLKRRVEG